MQWCTLTLEQNIEVIRDVDDRGRVKATGKDYKSGDGWIAARRKVRAVVTSQATKAVKFDRELEPGQHTIPTGPLEVYLVGAVPLPRTTHPLPSDRRPWWQ